MPLPTGVVFDQPLFLLGSQVKVGFWHFTENKEAEWDGLLDETAETL